MLVTEDEAKTKRCQEGFAAADGISADGIPVMQPTSVGPAHSYAAAGYYGVSHGGAPMNCIGSACMAWRWRADTIAAVYEECTTKGGSPTHGKDWELVARDDGAVHKLTWRRLTKPEQPPRGFCGKAGPTRM